MNQDVAANRKLFLKEFSKGKEESCDKIKKRSLWIIILRICIIWILLSRLCCSTCVALMVFRKVITLEESQLGELNWS